MVVMLNDVLQPKFQVKGRESATKTLLMIGYMSEWIWNQGKTREMSCSMDRDILLLWVNQVKCQLMFSVARNQTLPAFLGIFMIK